MLTDASGQTPTTTTQAPPDDFIWTSARRDGGYADEVDSWRASAEVSPPVWMRHRPRDMSARREVTS